VYPEFLLDESGSFVEGVMEENPEKTEVSFLDESYEQAQTLLNAARLEAEDIKEKARQEGQRLGEEEGYQAGVERAMNEYRMQHEEELQKLRRMIQEYMIDVEHQKEKILELYIDDLKNIALSIGEKIVQTSLRSSAQVVQRMILAATSRMKKKAWAKIYIGKGQESMDISGDTNFLHELSRLSENVKIVMMDEEEAGTCIIELPDEVIDLSVATQLENIKEILNNARLS
jgi:flagellar assembly protein FliH